MAEPVLCSYDEQKNTEMVKAYNIAKTITPSQNARIYMDELFNSYRNKMDIEPNFLERIECFLIKNLFEKIVKETGLYFDNGQIEIKDIKENDILFITCPEILSEYHYITAVISEDKTEVDIYQSFGASIKLYKLTLPFNDFIGYLEVIKSYKTPESSFFVEKEKIYSLENNLYGINIKTQLEMLEKQNKDDDENDEDNEDEYDYDDRTEQEKAEDARLGITLFESENLRRGYQMYIDPAKLSITAYRIHEKKDGGKNIKNIKNIKNKKTKKRIKSNKLTKRQKCKRLKKTLKTNKKYK